MVTSLNSNVAARDTGYQFAHTIKKRVTFSDVATTVTVGKIPAGATITSGGVHVVTAFNATTTNVMNVGFIGATTNASGYASALSTAAIGFIVLDDLALTGNIQGTAEHTITATLTETGAASTAGAADIIVIYVPTSNP